MIRRRGPTLAWFFVAHLCAGAAAAGESVRLLFDFETSADIRILKGTAEGIATDLSHDFGVTSGKVSCRLVSKQGGGWSYFEIKGDRLRGFDRFDCFVMDVYIPRKEKLRIVFELWDELSLDGEYGSRHTIEEVHTHEGQNRLVYGLRRAVRNRKRSSSLSWRSMPEEDKIKLHALEKVKIFFKPFAEGGDTMLWVDSIRLAQEEALGGKIKIDLPEAARAFDFGAKGFATPGFSSVEAGSPALKGKDVENVGKDWPDGLTGNGIASRTGPFQVDLPIPDGDYRVWLSAGKVIDEKTRRLPFLLRVGDRTLCDETLSLREFYGEKGLFRHMRTQYSRRPNALWLDYVLPVCPEETTRVRVSGGKLTVDLCNHRLAALVAVPAREETAFRKLTDDIRAQRLKHFYGQRHFEKLAPPEKKRGDGDYVLWVPEFTLSAAPGEKSPKSDFLKAIHPWTGPTEEERRVRSIALTGARGERLVARLCVSAFEDLGVGEIEVSDLRGPGTIPSANVRRYFKNHRVKGSGVQEMALLPWTRIRFEKGVTWTYWLWIEVPDDAAPGRYRGTITFRPEKSRARRMPLRVTVYPFALEDVLPVSYGMYYRVWNVPEGVSKREVFRRHFAFMREIGFTATELYDYDLRTLEGGNRVGVHFDPVMWEAAEEAGLGRHPEQKSISTNTCLGFARQIARKLGLNPAVDQSPGIEFTKPELEGYYKDAIRQYADHIRRMGIPMAVQIVDEPREMCMPWNRNMEHTIKYSDWAHEVGGVTTYIGFSSDSSRGRDYTPIADHVDIVATHAYPSSGKLIRNALEKNQTLWFYNTGMDRFSWGFYPWRMKAKGRWEWHWRWDTPPVEGYPNPDEWYTPFSGRAESRGMTLAAPYSDHFPYYLTFKSPLLDTCRGINDYAYLVTLEKAIRKAGSDPARRATVAKARAFLDEIRRAVPMLPKSRTLDGEDAGALVGEGLVSEAAGRCEEWRLRIAEFMIALERAE